MVSMLRYTATFFVLLGALATTLRIDPLNIWLLNIGTSMFLFYSIKIRNLALVIVNAGLLIIYVIGLFIPSSGVL